MQHNLETLEKSYAELMTIIKERQKFEADQNTEPYKTHKTDLNFPNIKGRTLLQYAAEMGDLEKVKLCLKEGAHINLPLKKPPIAFALENGHLEVAQFLFEQGALCYQVETAICKDQKCKHWFSEELRKAMSSACSPDNYPTLLMDNQFFATKISTKNYTNIEISISIATSLSIDPAIRAAEIGDLDFLRSISLSTLYPADNQDKQKKIDSILIAAAENGQLEVLRQQLVFRSNLSPFQKYTKSALHAAISNHQDEVFDFLVEEHTNINTQNHIKYTPLMTAVLEENSLYITKLLEKDADFRKKSIEGETILHLAVTTNNVEIVKQLLAIPDIQQLLNEKNIYGQTALQIAVGNKNDEIITVLAPHISLERIKKSKFYGYKLIPINQNAVMESMIYYLRSNYRDLDIFNMEGNCNGFEYIYELFKGRGMQKYFFDTLALMVTWNGQPASLKTAFANTPKTNFFLNLEEFEQLVRNEFVEEAIPIQESESTAIKTIPQAEFYSNKEEVFEQWINDLIWFQHSNENLILNSAIKQDDRKKQYAIIGEEKKEYEPILLYKDSGNRSEEQMLEFLQYIKKMPIGVRMEYSGTGHGTSGDKSADYFDFYDPNFIFRTTKTNDVKEIFQRLLDFEVIAIEQYNNNNFHFAFSLFYFKKDENKLDFNEFQIFSIDEYPLTPESALDFQINSPNKLTHLHIAVMTHSLASLTKLIEDGYCDMQAKNIAGKTAFELALDNGFLEAVKIMLPVMEIKDNNLIIKILIEASKENDDELLQFVLKNKQVENINAFLYYAIKNHDLVLVKQLIESNKININKCENNTLPLIEALKVDDEAIVKYLLQSGAKLTIGNKAFSPTTTPLLIVLSESTNLKYLPIILEHLKKIDELDAMGNAAIHYAAKYANAQAITKLIKAGANLSQKNSKGQLAFDVCNSIVIAKTKNLFTNKIDKKHVCTSLLLTNTSFNLKDTNDKNYLTKNLFTYLENDNNELFKLFVEKCGLDLVNDTLSSDDLNVLQEAILARNLNKANILLSFGANPDIKLSNGDTLLMTLIELSEENYPSKNDDLPTKYDLIKLLLQHHADVDKVLNKQGESALDLVNKSDDSKLKEIFQEMRSTSHFVAK